MAPLIPALRSPAGLQVPLIARRVAGCLVALVVASIAGCGVRASLKQRLEGEWVGRAESAVERSRREWPRAVGANAPKYDQRSDESLDGIPDGALAQVDAVPPTTLEQFAGVRVNLELMSRSKARLTLEGGEGGGPPLTATWKASAGEGGAAVLELTVDRSPDDAVSTGGQVAAGDDAKPVIGGAPGELRRFELRFLSDGERFTLMEEGADPRYGRLLFERAN